MRISPCKIGILESADHRATGIRVYIEAVKINDIHHISDSHIPRLYSWLADAAFLLHTLCRETFYEY